MVSPRPPTQCPTPQNQAGTFFAFSKNKICRVSIFSKVSSQATLKLIETIMAEAVNQSEGRWKNQKEDGKRGCDQARCGDKRDGGGCQDVRDGETEVIRSNLSTKSTWLALLKLV